MKKIKPQELINILGSISKYKYLCFDHDLEPWLWSDKPIFNELKQEWWPPQISIDTVFDILPEGFVLDLDDLPEPALFEYSPFKESALTPYGQEKD